jgi:hypothetical protein
MFGQIGPTGRKVGGHFGQKCPKFENFVRTKMGGFGKFWDQTFMGIIRGPKTTRARGSVQNLINCKFPKIDMFFCLFRYVFLTKGGGGVNAEPLFAKIDPVSCLKFRCPFGLVSGSTIRQLEYTEIEYHRLCWDQTILCSSFGCFALTQLEDFDSTLSRIYCKILLFCKM